MKNNSQNFKILNHMINRRSITPMEALNKYGCFRLASRIHDLSGLGLEINRKMVTKNNKKYAEYSLN